MGGRVNYEEVYCVSTVTILNCKLASMMGLIGGHNKHVFESRKKKKKKR